MPACPNCQESIKADWGHCPHCGADLKTSTYSKDDDPLDKLQKRVDKIDEYLTDQAEKGKDDGKDGKDGKDKRKPASKRKTLFGD
jgi:transcription initiation factor IIE alpha subunit